MAKKKITTIEELAALTQKGFRTQGEKFDKKIDNLAITVQREFLEVGKEFGKIHGRFDKVEADIAYLKSEVADIRVDLDEVKRKLGEMVFRFEIQGLERRVRRMEMKLGLGR